MSIIRSAFTLYPLLGFPITERLMMLCKYGHTGPHWVLPAHMCLAPCIGVSAKWGWFSSRRCFAILVPISHDSELSSIRDLHLDQVYNFPTGKIEKLYLNLWPYFLVPKKSLWHCACDCPGAIGSDTCLAAATVSIQFHPHKKYWLL